LSDVDFVGSLETNHGGPPPDPDFDLDHEGHWGWRADEIINGRPGEGKLADWLDEYTPDIVLLHLGTNDALQGQSPFDTVEELEEIIAILRADNPNVTILLAKLIPSCHPDAINIIALNLLIPLIAEEHDTPESPVILVDQTLGFNAMAHTYDCIHPNETGENKMAERWEMALDVAVGALER
jgi:lysophospholipase L1-like esterase